MNLFFKDFGAVLAGRRLAAEIRNQLDSYSGEVVLDFSEVRTVSHSFADELIGKLALKYGAHDFKNKFRIINLSESNRNIFNYVISDRLAVNLG